jgi:hypothetical protein
MHSPASVSPPGSHPFRSNVNRNEISTHAYRHFEKHYHGISDPYWLKQDGKYIVSFSGRDERTEVYYDQKGYFQFEARYYGPSTLDADTKRLVGLRFPGFKIAVVIDLMHGEKQFTLLKLYDDKDCKTVRYLDGKMEEIEEFQQAPGANFPR